MFLHRGNKLPILLLSILRTIDIPKQNDYD